MDTCVVAPLVISFTREQCYSGAFLQCIVDLSRHLDRNTSGIEQKPHNGNLMAVFNFHLKNKTALCGYSIYTAEQIVH